MARLQILELPEGAGGDRAPFALVVDQYEPRRYITGFDQPEPVSEFDNVAEKIGARAVLIFEETVDIPANAITRQAEPLLRVGEPLAGDEVRRLAKERDELHAELGLACGQLHSAALSAIRGRGINIRELIERAEMAETQRAEARSWARHGYEIGQRHCGWTDHGVAPHWLTEGWPPHFDSCEHLKQMAAFDEALTRVRNLSTQPEAMNADQEHPDVWKDGYRCGVLAARSATRPRDEETTKP